MLFTHSIHSNIIHTYLNSKQDLQKYIIIVIIIIIIIIIIIKKLTKKLINCKASSISQTDLKALMNSTYLAC